MLLFKIKSLSKEQQKIISNEYVDGLMKIVNSGTLKIVN